MSNTAKNTRNNKISNARAAALITALSFCLCALMFITGCATSQSATSVDGEDGDASEDEDVNIDFVLDYTPNTNHTGIYVAQELGYFKENGLDVRIVQPPEDGADALVASGNAQMGMSYQDVMANYLGSEDPLPVTAVAAIIQHNTSGILSAEEADIASPKDLEGKRYATWDQAVEQAIVRSVMESDGANFDNVELIPIGMSDEVGGLEADQFDASWGYEAWAVQNAKTKGVPVNYFSFISIDPVFDFYTPVIIANDAFLDADPEAVSSFLSAIKRGYQYAAENPEEAAKIMVDAVPELDYDLVLESQKYLSDKYADDWSSWGVFDPDRWNAFYEWMNDNELTEKEVPLDTAFTNAYLTD